MVIIDLARVHATQTLHMSRVCASRDCSLLVWYAAQQPTPPLLTRLGQQITKQ